MDHAARAEVLLELGGLRVVGVLRLFLGVEVVEVAEELVEAVVGRQHLVAVAEMVLAELAGDIAERLEQRGDRRVLDLHALRRARQADLGEAGADRRLAGDEGGAAGGAALLAVPVGEQRALLGDAVDVGRAVAHHAAVVGADIELADVIAPDDEDVRLVRLRERSAGRREKRNQPSRDGAYHPSLHLDAPWVLILTRCPARRTWRDFQPLPSCGEAMKSVGPRRLDLGPTAGPHIRVGGTPAHSVPLMPVLLMLRSFDPASCCCR